MLEFSAHLDVDPERHNSKERRVMWGRQREFHRFRIKKKVGTCTGKNKLRAIRRSKGREGLTI